MIYCILRGVPFFGTKENKNGETEFYFISNAVFFMIFIIRNSQDNNIFLKVY